MLLQNIQEKQNGELKEMSSKGTITADIIKNARYYVAGNNKNEQSFKLYWDKIKGSD